MIEDDLNVIIKSYLQDCINKNALIPIGVSVNDCEFNICLKSFNSISDTYKVEVICKCKDVEGILHYVNSAGIIRTVFEIENVIANYIGFNIIRSSKVVRI